MICALANATITGEPILDILLNFGIPGLAMYFLYKGLSRKDGAVEKLVNQMSEQRSEQREINARFISALDGIEGRLRTIEQKEDSRETLREKHLAVFEELSKQIAKEQARMAISQESMTKVLERQLAIMEAVNKRGEKMDDKIDECKTELRVLREQGGCKVAEATVKANVKGS